MPLLGAPTAIRNNDHTYVRRHLHDLEHWISIPQVIPRVDSRASREDLSNLVSADEIHDLLCDVVPFEDPRLNVEVTCKV